MSSLSLYCNELRYAEFLFPIVKPFLFTIGYGDWSVYATYEGSYLYTEQTQYYEDWKTHGFAQFTFYSNSLDLSYWDKL